MAYCILKMKTYKTCKSIKLVNDEEIRNKHYDDIDETKTHLNRTVYGNKNYLEMYNQIMQNDYYTKADKYGRTHKEPNIKGIGFIATFSPEAKNQINPKQWIIENVNFFKEVFKNSPMTVTLHLDQTTPHLHIFVIPVTEKGKISKSQYINGKKDMFNLQDRYAEKMQQFGLERGERKEKADLNHTDKETITKYKKIKNANMQLKKQNEELQNEIDELIRIRNAVEYDINNLADIILEEEYKNPYRQDISIEDR